MVNEITVKIHQAFSLNQPLRHKWGRAKYYTDLKNEAQFTSSGVKLNNGIFDFTFYLKRAMDADNIGGMVKAILDGFRESNALVDDNKKCVAEVRYRVVSPVKSNLAYVDIKILPPSL